VSLGDSLNRWLTENANGIRQQKGEEKFEAIDPMN